MNKKVISSVLVGAMAVSTLGVTASATTGNTTDSNVKLSAKASLLEATINADLPQDVETFINPYGATVEVKNDEDQVASVFYSDGLISPTYTITNYDSKALKVSATATITPSSTVAVNTKVLDDAKLQKTTEKQVFAFLNTTIDEASGKPIFASTKYVSNDNQLAFTEDGAKAAGIMTVAAKDDAGDVGYFYVGGQCTPNPEEAWTSKDTVTVDLVLDLSPSAGDPADLTLKSIDVASGKIEFDAATMSYEIAAAGSKGKAATIVATANDSTAKVYVKFNGKIVNATAAQSAAVDKIGVTAAGAAVTITPSNDGATPTANPVDYKAGDKLEIIVVSTTNESATYTITFTE